jgi:hypothetical protein
MSHAYSFAAITAFLFFCRSFFVNRKSVYIIPAFIALGFTILLRPFNGLILLAVPFIAGDFNTLKSSIQLLIKKYYLVLAGGVLAFLIVSLQFLIWYKQTGHFIVYSYTYERFYFDKPHLLQVLFSYRKGIFIYTPLCFVALAGLIYLWKNNKFQTLTFLGFFLVLTYIMSCWHQWFYGGSLGFRPIIEYLSLFAILLLFAFRLINRRWMRTVAIFLCLFFVYVNQVQAYQYPRFILHWEKMSKYKFWKVFLRTDDKWIGYVWENPEPADIDGDKVAEYFTDFEQPDKNWTGSAMYDQGAKAHSGKMVTGLFENVIYSNTMILKGDEKLAAMNKPAVFIRGYTHQDGLLKSNELKFVISYDKPEGGTYYYKSRLVDNFTASDKGWKKFEIALTIDKLKSKGDLIKMYFWNPEKKAYLIDDVTITFIDAY